MTLKRLFTVALLAVLSIGAQAITSLSEITNPDGNYVITQDIDASGFTTIASFSGTLEAAIDPTTHMPYKISGLSAPLFTTLTGTVKNLVLKDVSISGYDGNTGAIACTANGAALIYNIGILSGSVGGSGNVGGLVGLLDGTARVINCYSYADITSGGSTSNPQKYVGGLVGNNNQTSTQESLKTIVVNCMYYGEISSSCKNIAPVYGNKAIENNKTNSDNKGIGINPYCYFRGEASFNNKTVFSKIDNYKRSWPAEEEYLTRFEYYRSILNSNRQLCAFWVTGNTGIERTSDDANKILKWVLDPEIAKYPILKEWGKYPSIINPDKVMTIDPTALTPTWSTRPSVSESTDNGANAYKGGIFKNLSVSVSAGSGHAGSKPSSTTISLPITDMDIQNHDFGYYKVQLPYYNEIFGDPTSNDHNVRYGGNYKDKVVTGWKITSVTGGTDVTNKAGTDANGVAYDHTFTANWESGYNFADRYCTTKDIYSSTNPRVFAQGGFFYVPEGVTSIAIEAYWGKAVYLHNSGHYIDRVNITNKSGNRTVGDPFSIAGTQPTTFQGQTVWDQWHTAVTKLDEATRSDDNLSKTVYDQAIVLLSNFQLKNENGAVGTNITSSHKWYPYTIMSIDQDLDNEPDYCFEFQFRNGWNRDGIQPIRFDFLPVPELGMAVRHSTQQNTIGIFIPQGHFEITETSFMHLTQFEYDGDKDNKTITGKKVPAPIILNGGHFDQLVVRYTPFNNTQYFLMGGHFRMLRFAPCAHTNKNNKPLIRLCAVNAVGGEYPEFYLSGIYRPDLTPTSVQKQGNPHCYTNGGYFGIMAGGGYDKILGSITFKIDHSLIDEFYGGGINGSKPIGGNINVTIDNSLVTKYCGGPKVGLMVDKTVTTNATGTTFVKYYGGGNGGTSYYRDGVRDGNDWNMPDATAAGWGDFGYKTFNPLNTISGVSPTYEGPGENSENKGYHALFEFECFVESNGLGAKPTLRSYRHWAQFGSTTTGTVSNRLTRCTIENDFYGGGNLANVGGDVNSTLTDCIIKGSAFGGGYSGTIEPFRIHDKGATEFPYIDGAGVMQNGNGKFSYVKNADGTDRYYTWCYRKSDTEFLPKGVVIPSNASTTTNLKATFEYPEGSNNWYVLTTVSLEGLGAVSGNTSLTINGTTEVKGSVYGGGNESTVNGNTNVYLKGNAQIAGDVFGGGNKAKVEGGSTVNIED